MEHMLFIVSTVLGLTVTLFLTLTLPDLSLSIFHSIPCLVSGRRFEPIIILIVKYYKLHKLA